jgi:hypothetical protein
MITQPLIYLIKVAVLETDTDAGLLKERIQRARNTAGMRLVDNDGIWEAELLDIREGQEHDDFIDELLENAPETYNGDAAAEAIIVQYVRDLEVLRDYYIEQLPPAVVKAITAGGY